jgi:DNA-binding response OmpR family regulator
LHGAFDNLSRTYHQPIFLIAMCDNAVQTYAMKLLLIEDDTDLSHALSRALIRRGFEVAVSFDGLDALERLSKSVFDGVVLDLTLPGVDGLELLTRMRGRADKTPVLVLTARAAVDDRIKGLNGGADDYVLKPFDLDELEARLRALLRRAHGDERVVCGALQWERATGVFYRDAAPVDFGPREHALLTALMRPPGRAVTRERLIRLVFAGESSAQLEEALDVLVHRLRRKLVGLRVEIMTLRGLGYLLRDLESGTAE